MSARYVIRLDDACSTMHRKRWKRVEEVLDRYSIKPIAAVIPANRDPGMMFGPPDPGFWRQVGTWQNKGWSIALHGYDHVYISSKGGLVPIEDRSEFADVPIEIQRDKIRKGYKTFIQRGIRPHVWVAPAHSFDRNSLRALKEETNISLWTICLHPNTISDQKVKSLEHFVKENAGQIISVIDIVRFSKYNMLQNRIFSTFFWIAYGLKKLRREQ